MHAPSSRGKTNKELKFSLHTTHTHTHTRARARARTHTHTHTHTIIALWDTASVTAQQILWHGTRFLLM